MKITKVKNVYMVDSPSGKQYEVTRDGWGAWSCTCPDHKYRGNICKHIRAVIKHIKDKDNEDNK